MAAHRLSEVSGSARRWLILRSLVRSVLSVTGMLLLYFLIPLERFDLTAGLVVTAGLVGLAVLFSWQLTKVVRAPFPGLRALEMLTTGVPLFLLLFAAAYEMMGMADDGAFNEALSRADALYFTVTVFATVGFGDIVPVDATARGVVTVQMIADLIVIGALVRAVFGAVQGALRKRTTEGGAPDPGPPAPDPDQLS